MNLSANMLGLDNAATPMGLKAMRELQKLNPVKDTATNSMVMFLAINTSSITLVPFTIIGYRAASGSTDPAGPMVGILLATSVEHLRRDRIHAMAGSVAKFPRANWRPCEPPATTPAATSRLPEETPDGTIFQSLNVGSQWTIPATILLIVVWAAYKRVPMYESFVTGAKEGFDIAVMIIPYLVAMLFVIKVFMASGIFDDVKSGGTLALQAVGLGGLCRDARPVAAGVHPAAHRQRLAGAADRTVRRPRPG